MTLNSYKDLIDPKIEWEVRFRARTRFTMPPIWIDGYITEEFYYAVISAGKNALANSLEQRREYMFLQIRKELEKK